MPNGGVRAVVAALAAAAVTVATASAAPAAPGDMSAGFEVAGFWGEPPLAMTTGPGGEVYFATQGSTYTRLQIGRLTAAGVDHGWSDSPAPDSEPGQWVEYGAWFRPTGITRQPDGKLVVVGTEGYPSGGFAQSIGVVRVLPTGELDPTFDGDGKAVIPRPIGTALTTGRVAVGATGRIVVSAVERSATSELVTMYAVGAGGKLDKTFGNQGRAVVLGGAGETIGGVGSPLAYPVGVDDGSGAHLPDPRGSFVPVSIASNGKIMTGAGVCEAASVCSVAAVRLTGKGAPDATFSGDGRIDVPAPVTPATFTYYDIHALAGGHVLVVTGNGPTDVLARIRTDGTFNPSFGTAGIKTLPGVGKPIASAVQPDGKVLTLSVMEVVKDGNVSAGSSIVRRWHWNGSRDTGFGTVQTPGAGSGYVPRYNAFGRGANAWSGVPLGMAVGADNTVTVSHGTFASGDGTSGDLSFQRFDL